MLLLVACVGSGFLVFLAVLATGSQMDSQTHGRRGGLIEGVRGKGCAHLQPSSVTLGPKSRTPPATPSAATAVPLQVLL